PSALRLAHLRAILADRDRARALLPPRLAIFGPSTLPPGFVALLQSIAASIPVLLYVPTPSPEFFGDLRRRRRAIGAAAIDDDTGNLLLARLGAEARDFQSALGELSPVEARDLHPGTDREPATLLQCLQADIAAVREHGRELPRFPLRPDDESLLVHDCHSELRELEVVRDRILAGFADDPTLAPHDVLVLVPDVERYAPYAHAVFDPIREHLPFQIADKRPRDDSPIAGTIFRTLRLAASRLLVFDVLHLLEEPAVQRRFGLGHGDLPTLRHLCERAGIRWGADGEMRERQFHVPAFDDNAWRPGLWRCLLGVATGPTDDLVLGELPAADRTSGREELVVRLVHFVDTLLALLRSLQRPLPLTAWADRLDELAAALFLPATAADEQGLGDLRAAATELRARARAANHIEPVPARVFESWLELALGGAAASQGFLSGRVTLAAMLPMRAVPVRRLFLCGLDDESFPRRDRAAPFDLAALQPRTGDRSLRLDDRQLFLDCLMAAREQLHITHIGRSQKDDSERAPSVVLAELLDAIDRATATADGRTPRALVHVRHPLQPWSPRYLDGSDPRLFTFARPAADVGPPPTPVPEPVFCAEPLAVAEPATPEPLEFAELVDFFGHPCRWFLKHQLGVWLPRGGDLETTTEPFRVDNLERWRLLNDRFERARAGVPPPRDPLAFARATGRLPVGGAGAATFGQLEETYGNFDERHRAVGELAPRAFVLAGDDFVLRGELAEVGHDALVYTRLGSLGEKDRLKAWLQHVVGAALRARGEPLPATTRMVTRDKDEALRAIDPEGALGYLADLVAAFRSGRPEPLPLFPKSSAAYGKAVNEGRSPEEAMQKARLAWQPRGFADAPPSDGEDEHVALCMRGRDALALPGFAVWAERIWAPIWSHSE
ncbi:MAG: exodeoxyribonuclease V subunit gamma, partial [Planctomycetes bacterium]|nr:exodeoxyribonuclease V subunit gamma [Planctomycetota bacterium]